MFDNREIRTDLMTDKAFGDLTGDWMLEGALALHDNIPFLDVLKPALIYVRSTLFSSRDASELPIDTTVSTDL